MIIFKTLKWGNMFSYGKENCINLNDSPVTQLIGFNGNGKSSIPLILEETLYNKNSKGTKRQDVLNRNQKEKSYWCKLEFSIDGIDYTIDAKRSSTHVIKLTESGVDISGHTATQTLQKIEELIGLDFKTFSQVVYQNSNSSLQFLTATDTNRKKFLIDLLALDKYVELFEKFKELHKQYSDKLISVKAIHASTESWLKKHSSEDLTEQSLVEVPEFPKDLEIELNRRNTELLEADSYNKKIDKNQQYKTLRERLPFVTTLGKKQDTSHLSEELGRLQAELSKNNTLLTKVRKLGSSCPTCEQSVTEEFKNGIIQETTANIEALTASIEEAKVATKKILDANEEVSKSEKILADFEKYSSLIDSTLPSTLKDKEVLAAGIKELQARISAAMAAIKFAEASNQKAVAHNSRVATIVEQLDSYKNKLAEATIQLNDLGDELSYLEVLKKAFSTNGLLAYKIESSVKDLEKLSNFYLTELSSGRFQISYTINNDKLNIVITDNGNDITIDALSGGELARVTTSTLLAIRRLMSTISKSRINVLFLDETIDTLDADGKERLIEILLNEPDINVFLVSHGYTHPLLNKITVVKEKNISRLEE